MDPKDLIRAGMDGTEGLIVGRIIPPFCLRLFLTRRRLLLTGMMMEMISRVFGRGFLLTLYLS